MIFLGIFIFFIFLLAAFRKKNTRDQEAVEERFWTRENRANNTRRQDISGLPYITIPLEKFPIGICENEEIKEYENTLQMLSGKKIVNLGTQTNTDLKLKYGPANLSTLTEYDQNFTVLCRTLVAYAEHLLKLGYEAEATGILEYGISCDSDISKNYLLLADIYKSHGRTAEIEALAEHASQLDSVMKNSIIKHLKERTDA